MMEQEIQNQLGTSECSTRPNNSTVTGTAIVVISEEGESVSGEDGGVCTGKDNDVEMSKVSMDKLNNHQGIIEGTLRPNNQVLTKTVIVVRSEEGDCVSGEDEEVCKLKDNEVEMSKVLMDKLTNHQGIIEGTSRPNNPVVTETVIMVRSEEGESVSGDAGVSKVKDNVVEMSKVSIDKLKSKVSEPEKHNCVIDIKCNCGTLEGENKDGEKVCRICHLSGDRPSEAPDLIPLGCRCKDELGIAHRHCAEAWFKLKGNRCCEICGEAAKNITGVWDNRFMEEWNERRYDGTSGNSSDRRCGFWRGQPFCNFLMACLVMAFVLPWFFRVNMF
ncbi:zinc finger protein [Macleaya cordata]|uniref:Zinc finger protein n=1 Tax=Macleaya cordata TaxID=56857 RepID=A0A200QXL2_MACCD|nr:zinc finger protein [Macleaya cordata]